MKYAKIFNEKIISFIDITDGDTLSNYVPANTEQEYVQIPALLESSITYDWFYIDGKFTNELSVTEAAPAVSKQKKKNAGI